MKIASTAALDFHFLRFALKKTKNVHRLPSRAAPRQARRSSPRRRATA